MNQIDGVSIGGVEIQPQAAGRMTQSYTSRRISSNHVMADGSVKRQTLAGTASKITTQVSGSGWIPLGLQGIDTTIPHLVKCSAPVAVASASNVITLPAARRSDAGFEPTGYAIVNGEAVSTTVAMAGDTATLGIIPGASAYYAQYVPQITAWVDIQPQSLNGEGAEFSFSILATEV